MLDFVTVAIAAAIFVGGLVFRTIVNMREKLGTENPLPVTSEVNLSAKDIQMAEETRNVIRNCFGEDPVAIMFEADTKTRINLMVDFAQQLTEAYGLDDVTVDVTIASYEHWGAYNWNEKKAVFNIALLAKEMSEEDFRICLRELLDTVVHELRHAVQSNAMQNEELKTRWQIDDERLQIWANNMMHYIRHSVDTRGYAEQPIEADAATFAAHSLKGVIEG